MSALWTLIDLIIAVSPIILALFLLLAYWRWRDAEDDPAPDDRHHVEVRGLCTCEKGLCGAAETFSGHAGGDWAGRGRGSARSRLSRSCRRKVTAP